MTALALVERPQPQAAEAERVVLGAILVDQALMPQALELGVADFVGPRARAVWRAMRALYDRGEAIDPVTLRAELKGDPEAPSAVDLVGLMDGLPRLSRIAEWVTLVKRAAAARGLLAQLSDATSALWDGESVSDVLPQVTAAVDAAARRVTPGTDMDHDALLRRALDSLTAELEPAHDHGIPTQIRDLNRRLSGGGIQRGQLVYVGARPSMGKTALLLGLAEAAAAAGKRVLFFSLEMPAERMMRRRLIAASGINVYEARRDRDKREAAYSKLAMAPGRLARYVLTDNRSRTTDELKAEVARHAMAGGLDLVVVDYLGCIRPHNRQATPYVATTQISADLRQLKSDFDVAVVAAVQLNRQSEQRGDRTPGLHDFRESGGLEADCDVALFPYQPAKLLELPQGTPAPQTIQTGRCLLHLAKQRDGYTGHVAAYYQAETASFFDAVEER